MVRMSDVFGGGFKKPEERKPPVSPPPSQQESVAPPAKPPELDQRRLQEEAQTLYREGLSLIGIFFDKVRLEEPLPVEKVREFVKKTVLFMAGDGDPLLVFTTGISSGNFLHAHSLNVLIICLKVGLGLRYDKLQLIELGLAAFLHDIGMAKIPQEILNKTDKLTPEEFEQVKQHPFYSVSLLEKTREVEPVILSTISQEHERLDGSGYPKGIAGEEINPYARIVGLVDVYEALTHARPYRKHYTPDEAMKMIVYSTGTSFKPDVVDILKALARELSLYPVGSYVQLNTKEIGRVLRINKNFPLLPVVEVLIGPRENKLEEPRQVDLSQEPLLHIKRSVDILDVMALLKESANGSS